jgi:superfamily I DNA/RNA helicase
MEFLDLSLRGGLEHGRWRIFGDFASQRIYRQHGSMTLDQLDADGRWPLVELRVNCRNTPAVAALACACVGVDPTYCRVLRADETDTVPEVHGWDDEAGQRELLVDALDSLRDAGFHWGDIAVLSPVADERCACVQLDAPPWRDRLERVAQYTPNVDAAAARAWVENAGARVRCATIHRFKGLEARAVVITDVTSLDETSRALLYVGATRTVERLVVLAARDTARELLHLLKDAMAAPS